MTTPARTEQDDFDEQYSGGDGDARVGRRKFWFKSSEKSKLKLVRTPSMQHSDPSLLRLRVPYAPLSLSMKKAALEQWSGLALLQPEDGAYARNFLICGMNALRAEVLDMMSMVHAMNEHKRVLTHAAVERFYAWLPIFAIYVERYLYVEEDIILKTIVERVGRVHRCMREGSRMQLRGRLQKAIRDMSSTQRVFVRSLPAGEKLFKLADLAELVAEISVEYTTRFVETLAPVVQDAFTRSEVDRMRMKFIKYVVSHVGADDLLVLYTRWMHPRDLGKWKARALMPAEFKYRSYNKWEKNVIFGHFIIPARFTDVLVDETTDDVDQAEQWREDLRRAQSARARLEAGEYDDQDEEEYEDASEGDVGEEGHDGNGTEGRPEEKEEFVEEKKGTGVQ